MGLSLAFIMLAVAGSYFLETHFRGPSLPNIDESIFGLLMGRFPAGKGFAQAIAAQKAGCPACLVAAVGEDEPGQEVSEWARRASLQACFAVKNGAPTGQASVHLGENGSFARMLAPGANRLLQEDDFPAVWWSGARALLCQFEANPRTTGKLLREARKRKIPTLLHAAPVPMEDVRATVAGVDLVLTGQQGFSEMVRQYHPGGYGDFTEEQIHALSDRHLHQLCRTVFLGDVVLILGARGSFVSTREDRFKLVPAVCGSPVTCKHGLDDCFVGSFAAGWLKESRDPFAAVLYANAASALAGARPYPSDPFPSEKAILDLLNNLPH